MPVELAGSGRPSWGRLLSLCCGQADRVSLITVDQEKNIAEAVALEEKAAALLKQSGALMDEARALRTESMRLRELARQLRPQKRVLPRRAAASKSEGPEVI
jgi:hypothetical protein